ncbi:flagellar motor protein MotA [Robbsia andropogonis]|uniref:Flagellar motor protein MotA n=1 Tax=Robbsia andropogonis TaxID=28092 RepID=A0A0F5K101_9BURK|nr:flagellar motor stator protein MotA [Robbsia andropogonis]KKB63801.1 flagellar motor protein MotA [Robbsia andropogonis]MCP1116550.1 flagellar motor stator protein MotA [Robbsia andropogonis]MCP1126771.1 flagellar motor stator protein MotA [Robbsia andropogonis]
MFVIIGMVLVVGCVVGSFIGAGGHIAALIQPLELLCILGAASGAFVISNPGKTIKATLGALPKAFKGNAFTKERYVQLISLLYELLQKARKDGMIALEADVESPDTSPIFQKYSDVVADHHLLDFIIDYLRMMSSGNLTVHEIQDLMDAEMETHHNEAAVPGGALQGMADGLPAFGIVAAVMGVVHTMGSVGAPPAVLGELIAGALVGTFLGILMAYGFIGPLATLINTKAKEEGKPYECVKCVLLASLGGYAPSIAVEFGRKVLFTHDRPSFNELEEAVKATKGPR